MVAILRRAAGVGVVGRARLSAIACGLLALASPLVASAQTTTPPAAVGSGPGGLDYGVLTNSFTTNVTPVLSQAMPYCIVLMGIWLAPHLLRRLINSFAHG